MAGASVTMTVRTAAPKVLIGRATVAITLLLTLMFLQVMALPVMT